MISPELDKALKTFYYSLNDCGGCEECSKVFGQRFYLQLQKEVEALNEEDRKRYDSITENY